ncbi:MAG: bifunctional hydroxymethylpyrimidine kinase/phosphomethylpyrimidine kinase [Planctomycetes bacterium]|nr:bifunctional hydroxymethylpyrimidine kinase/phosphomethylpyrimidine kinase [Planctomycetota bacterium]
MDPKMQKVLARAIASFPGQSIIVIGDVMLDHYVWGAVDRVSPEAPVPVLLVEKESELPGGAANVARNIVELGGKAALFGCVGKDLRAESLQALCQDVGIETHFTTDQRPTTTKVRYIAQNQQLLRADWEDPESINGKARKDLLAKLKKRLPDAGLVIISDYAKGVIAAEVVEVLRQCKVKVIVDPYPCKRELYQGFYLMTPNHKEAAEIAGTSHKSFPPLEAAAGIIKQYTENVLITCGGEGMLLQTSAGATSVIPARARQVYDVTGAGDTVVAVLSLALAAGVNLHEASVLANRAAGIAVGKVGTATVMKEELISSLQEDWDT